MKRRILSLLMIVITCTANTVFYSCSYDYDTMDNTSNMEKYLESKSYKEYELSYSKMETKMNQMIQRMDKEDIKLIAEAFELFMTNPQKYEQQLENIITQFINAEDANTLNTFAKEVQKNKTNFINAEDLFAKTTILEREQISQYLSNTNEIINLPLLKNGNEGLPSWQICEKQRDADLEYARNIFLCGTAVNTAVCLASAGGSAPIWWITEFGLAAYHDMAVRKAWDDYYRCLEANV